ncbi:MAG: class I SAM-dependent methyltransferase, partial [Ignavibacteria bacterium]|jgi:SAM-dependent methyltransferase|nr:class I SAM-dependent methyltransferase [Ignavibacteria bacterium]
MSGMLTAVFGSGSQRIARRLSEETKNKVELIVEDYESLITAELELSNSPEVKTRMMSFSATDFESDSFDLVYAQASVSGTSRVKILKEIKRILKPGGILCAGEIVRLSKETPRFVLDVWNSSGLSPVYQDEIESYYKEKNFSIVKSADLSKTLKDFYTMGAGQLKRNLGQMTEQEKSFNKKLINRMSHETNVYLKQGGDKHIGFRVLIVKNEK